MPVVDAVLVVINRLHHDDDRYRVGLHIVPAFARACVARTGDDDILAATRLLLTFKSTMEDCIMEPYKRVKAFEASGATSYAALPRFSPCGMLRTLEPAAMYTLICAYKYGLLLDLPARELFPYLWNVVVPESCARCGGVDYWALLAPLQAICHACGNTIELSDRSMPRRLGLA